MTACEGVVKVECLVYLLLTDLDVPYSLEHFSTPPWFFWLIYTPHILGTTSHISLSEIDVVVVVKRYRSRVRFLSLLLLLTLMLHTSIIRSTYQARRTNNRAPCYQYTLFILLGRVATRPNYIDSVLGWRILTRHWYSVHPKRYTQHVWPELSCRSRPVTTPYKWQHWNFLSTSVTVYIITNAIWGCQLKQSFTLIEHSVHNTLDVQYTKWLFHASKIYRCRLEEIIEINPCALHLKQEEYKPCQLSDGTATPVLHQHTFQSISRISPSKLPPVWLLSTSPVPDMLHKGWIDPLFSLLSREVEDRHVEWQGVMDKLYWRLACCEMVCMWSCADDIDTSWPAGCRVQLSSSDELDVGMTKSLQMLLDLETRIMAKRGWESRSRLDGENEVLINNRIENQWWTKLNLLQARWSNLAHL